jgi:hypothetical protein
MQTDTYATGNNHLTPFAFNNPQLKIEPLFFHLEEQFLLQQEVDDLCVLLKNTPLKKLNWDSPDSQLIRGHIGQAITKQSGSGFVDLNEQYTPFDQKIHSKLLELNNKLFKFDIDCRLTPIYHEYEPNGYIEWHLDNPIAVHGDFIPDNLKWRKLSMTILLNDWFKGGAFDLITMEQPCKSVKTVQMERGDAIIFPSFLQHRVNKIEYGTRKSLTYFYCGPRWR